MKLIKLSEEHYIVVDDSEIKEGDFVYSSDGGIFKRHIDNPCQTIFPISKVTRSTEPLDKSLFFTNRVWGCERLSLGEVKELLGVVDVEKKALEYNRKKFVSGFNPKKDQFAAGIIVGWQQALEDNKEKKWTDEDIIRIVEKSRETGLTAEYIILTLSPKTEWEVEIVDGKLKLV